MLINWCGEPFDRWDGDGELDQTDRNNEFWEVSGLQWRCWWIAAMDFINWGWNDQTQRWDVRSFAKNFNGGLQPYAKVMHIAHQLFAKMILRNRVIMRGQRVHHRNKMGLAPKSWMFKFKGHLEKKRRLDVQYAYHDVKEIVLTRTEINMLVPSFACVDDRHVFHVVDTNING